MPPRRSPRALDPHPILTLAVGGADIGVADAVQEQAEKEAKKVARVTKKAVTEAKKAVKAEQEAKRKMAVEVLREAEKLIWEKERAKVANNLVLPMPATPVFSTAGRSASQSPGPTSRSFNLYTNLNDLIMNYLRLQYSTQVTL